MSDNTELLQEHEGIRLFRAAEDLFTKDRHDEAEMLYTKLLSNMDIAPIASFRLGQIKNKNGHVQESYEYHKKAFELQSTLATRILSQNHINYHYIYNPVEEVQVLNCPLCGEEGKVHSVYNMISNNDYMAEFSPIRVWRICEKCHHIFAGGYPENISQILSNSPQQLYIDTNVNYLRLACDVLSNISKETSGRKLLDVGVGGGEMAAVAKEMLFDVTGVEIRTNYAEHVSKSFNIPVYCTDFMEFETDELFDIIILGDVIEHLLDPITVLSKAKALLKKEGVLWVSTPNFNSAFSNIMKDRDPMWRVCEHLNYFSYESLNKVLVDLGFKVMDYRVSKHYNGSMEVICKKVDA